MRQHCSPAEPDLLLDFAGLPVKAHRLRVAGLRGSDRQGFAAAGGSGTQKAVAARDTRRQASYNERRKFKISCRCDGLSALKLLMTP